LRPSITFRTFNWYLPGTNGFGSGDVSAAAKIVKERHHDLGDPAYADLYWNSLTSIDADRDRHQAGRACFMSHFREGEFTTPEEIYRRLDWFAELVPNVQLTGLDIDCADERLQGGYILKSRAGRRLLTELLKIKNPAACCRVETDSVY